MKEKPVTGGEKQKIERRNRVLLICLLALSDIILTALSVTIAMFITKSYNGLVDLFAVIALNVSLICLLYLSFGLYAIIFSSVSFNEAIKLAVAVVIVAFVDLLLACLSKFHIITFSAIVIATIFTYCSTLAVRLVKRLIKLVMSYMKIHDLDAKRVMIVGGGDAGELVIKEMVNSPKINFCPVCIVDDDPKKLNKIIMGVKVVGNTSQIPELCIKLGVEEIFVTMPSVKRKKQSKIINICKDCGIPVKVLPGIYQLASGSVSVSALRNVDVQDLLGRDQIDVNVEEIMGYIENKVVMVTGGGGSIGSELCRQIASHNPKKLIILDIYENNAYDIQNELLRKYPTLDLLALIASVRDKGKIHDVFDKYRPQIVFHAAAHKHVPLMETSPNEAVKNNVFGTLNVARCADEFKTEVFVQISTDKAVNPTNVMGATKRICEMIIQTIGKHSVNTKFVAVRFGNVLGSNGSVIPLFRKQISEGGPVTVTHKDIIRYFMTIPEAVSLVLQAGAYAKGGQIFVLDMGEPVKIYDLAENLIRLSGFKPNEDIKIVCTGLRPGEKLFEERLMAEEGMQKTPNGLISIASPIELDEQKLWSSLEKIYQKIYEETDRTRDLIKSIVPTFKPESFETKADEKPNNDDKVEVKEKPQQVEALHSDSVVSEVMALAQ